MVRIYRNAENSFVVLIFPTQSFSLNFSVNQVYTYLTGSYGQMIWISQDYRTYFSSVSLLILEQQNCICVLSLLLVFCCKSVIQVQHIINILVCHYTVIIVQAFAVYRQAYRVSVSCHIDLA